MATNAFASREVATFWRYLASTLDNFIELAKSLESDALHWKPPAPETNSIAVLITHIHGNLKESIFEVMAGEPVLRRRDEEFIDGPVTAATLNEDWEELRPRFEKALAAIPARDLERVRTHPRRGKIDGREVLIVVTRHAAEHLGQAELTRDLWAASDR